MKKSCTKCGEEKELDLFPLRKDGRLGRHAHCKDCKNKAYRESGYGKKYDEKRRTRWRTDPEYREQQRKACRTYQANNKAKINLKNKQRYRETRKALLEKYGGSCKCCGESRWEFLAIDHVDGGGGEERKTLAPTDLYKKLLKVEGLLPEYRILCHNCNSSLGFYGYCPHKDPK